MSSERRGWSPEIAAEIRNLHRGIFFDQERRAFARGCSRFTEGLPDGRVRRRMTREEFTCLDDAIAAIADSLIGPSHAATTPSGDAP